MRYYLISEETLAKVMQFIVTCPLGNFNFLQVRAVVDALEKLSPIESPKTSVGD